MNLKVFCVVLLTLNVFHIVHGSSILALFSSLSYADHLVYRSYVELLANRGHHVIVMTPYPGEFKYPEVERIVELDVSQDSSPFWAEYKDLHSNVNDHFPNLRSINELSIKVAIAQLKSQQMTAVFVNPNIKFDLVITEADVPALYAVAEKYKSPHIAITAGSGTINMYESKGDPNHPLLYPDVNTLNYGNLNVWQKFNEFRRYLGYKYEYYYYHLPLCQLVVEKIFGLKKDLVQLEEDIDMLFVAGNPMLLGNRPAVPGTIYVNNLHIKPAPIPQDLQIFLDKPLDKNNKGAILFSLGTVQESEDLSRPIVQLLLDAFSELPFTVLFKIGNTTSLKVPSNVHTNMWFPQQEVLAHQNIKAFVTHGGPRSLEEAVYYAVPIIGLPIVTSRKVFISQVTNHGTGEIVDPYYMNKETFKKIVLEVATNDTYRKAMINLRGLTLDNEVSGAERAVWFTEYVLQHRGAKHLRSPLVGIPFYKYFMLDIIAYVTIILSLTLAALYYIIRGVIKKVRARYLGANKDKGKYKSL